MFTKILIANRGVIACRIARTLKRLGITSVAVYNEADATSQHVKQVPSTYCSNSSPLRAFAIVGQVYRRCFIACAEIQKCLVYVRPLQTDERASLGAGTAAETYLNMAKIIDIALATGAQAIHPGYGFLSGVWIASGPQITDMRFTFILLFGLSSENTVFAEACTARGIVFIGPTPDQIKAFSLKNVARDLVCILTLNSFERILMNLCNHIMRISPCRPPALVCPS